MFLVDRFAADLPHVSYVSDAERLCGIEAFRPFVKTVAVATAFLIIFSIFDFDLYGS